MALLHQRNTEKKGDELKLSKIIDQLIAKAKPLTSFNNEISGF